MKFLSQRILSILVPSLLFMSAGVVNAQQASANTPLSPTSAAPANSESLLIGPGDLLHATVFRTPEMETHARVTDAGDITIPLLGKLHVAGLTPPEAARLMERSYTNGHYLLHPQVSMLVEEYATQSVAIMGEVARPGKYPVTTPRGIMDTLALAGGFTIVADRHITIQHGDGRKQEVFLPNNPSQSLSNDVTVYPGDLVIVPKAGIVYVLGDVARPGGYVMQDDSTLTVMQAVAMASGTNRTAKEAQARIVRRTASGFTEIPVPLKDMQKGKANDMALQNNDILWVPFSYARNFAITGTSVVGSAGSAAIYR